MSGVDAEIRLTHTIRLFGTNKDFDVLQDVWVDIERIDVFHTNEQMDGHWQGVFYRLYWIDDPEDPEYNGGDNGNGARMVGFKKICSPDEKDQEKPEQWIPVGINMEMTWNEVDKDGNNLQSCQGNRNDAENLARVVGARRVSHHDTLIDDAVDSLTSQDPTLRAVVVPSDKYNFIDNTKDDGDYVETMYATQTYIASSTDSGTGNQKDQNIEFNLKNDYVLNFTDEAKGPANENHGFDPPWLLDPFQNIVNVKWKTIYLVVVVNGANQSSSSGPYPAPSITAPSASADKNDAMKGIKLLDTYRPPAANNVSSGFNGCFNYLANPTSGPGLTPQQAWALFPGRTYAPINGVCVLSPPSAAEDGFAVSPANYFRTNETTTEYLYSVPAGTEIVTVKVGNIMPFHDSGFDSSLNTQTTSFGNASISAAVYSRVKGSVTKLSQLIDYNNDGKPRPTQDDFCIAGIAPYTGGTFQVNVALDKDPGHAQIDNYGKTFQPYKATITPGESTDYIPSQPPPSLIGVKPIPAKAAGEKK